MTSSLCQAAKLEVEVTSLRAQVRGYEKALKTTQAQLVALEERNRPRRLAPQEKEECQQVHSNATPLLLCHLPGWHVVGC